ncbi:MAG TPA: hypothetical protein VGI43_14995 [Mucilaginibacter sp.]|jgi:hypothetical protein
MEPNIEELRKNYESFPDEKLIRIATEEATGLRPEALELLRQIIKERGLSQEITKSIDAQFQKIDDKTLLEYSDLLRRLPCPFCNSNIDKLNATMTGTVVSFIFMTSYRKEIKIGCPKCLDKQNNAAINKSALLGWWGLPWGIVKTIQAFIFNAKMKKQNNLPEANDILKSFVLNRIGRIEASRNNPAELSDMILYIR